MANLKYVILGGGIALAGVVAYFGTFQDTKPAKYYMVEQETKVRPARFEDLKYHLEPGVELRSPASTGK